SGHAWHGYAGRVGSARSVRRLVYGERGKAGATRGREPNGDEPHDQTRQLAHRARANLAATTVTALQGGDTCSSFTTGNADCASILARLIPELSNSPASGDSTVLRKSSSMTGA